MAETRRSTTARPRCSSLEWRFQVDVIPATGTAYYTSNIEDGIALADAELRAAFAQHYPEAWGRIQAPGGRFMQDVLGMQLKPEVLPFFRISRPICRRSGCRPSRRCALV